MTPNDRKPPGVLPMLGIDLGTGTCLACYLEGDHPVYIRPDPDSPIDVMNSVYLAVPRPGGGFIDLVGPDAERAKAADNRLAEHLVRNVKRFMKEHDENTTDHHRCRSNGRKNTPAGISTLYLIKLREAAERQLGLPRNVRLTSAVVTVPADFGAKQLEATRLACVNAGFPDPRFLEEPVATAYSLRRRTQEGKEIALVADLGQGTFDLALLAIGKAAGKLGIAEIGRGGEEHLGGLDWDRSIAQWAAWKTTPVLPPNLQVLAPEQVKEFQERYDRLGHDQETQIENLCEGLGFGHEELFRAAEQAKRGFLSRGPEYGLAASQLISYQPLPAYLPLSVKMSSNEFLDQTDMLVSQCLYTIERLLAEVSDLLKQDGFGWKSIDNIYLAGGGHRNWKIQEAIKQRWNSGRDPILLGSPQHAVAHGAAIYAKAIQEGEIPPGDALIGRPRYAHTLGLRFGGPGNESNREPSVIIPRLTPLPFRTDPEKPRRFTTTGRRDARKLRLTFAEKKRDRDPDTPIPAGGVAADYEWEDFQTFRFTIPPSPNPEGTSEVLKIAVQCEREGNPTLEVMFRGVRLPAVLEPTKGETNGTSNSV